jgi:hypothetical protein
MSLPIEAAVPLFTLGWVAGVGTALVCSPARSSRTRRELRRNPPGWRSYGTYADAARVRHANSDNGAPSTPQPPIEPHGQSLALPKPAVDRDPDEGVSNDALRSRMRHDMGRAWATSLAEPQKQALVKPAFPPPREIRADAID